MTGVIRIGTAPGTWGVEPGSSIDQPPWELVLDEVAAAGFQGIELGPFGYLPTDRQQLAWELSSRGLKLSAGYVMEPLHEAAQTSRILVDAERTCTLLADVGAKVLVLIGALVEERTAAAGREDLSPRLVGRQRATFMSTLTRLVDLAHDRGLTAVLHPHAGTHVEFEQEVDRLLDEADVRLGLCVDTGHCMYSGIDAQALLERYADRVRHVHLKDVRRDVLSRALGEGLRFEQAVAAGTFCPLGQGSVDLAGFLARLREINYNGWATFEQDRLAAEYASARADAEQSLAHLLALDADTGSRNL